MLFRFLWSDSISRLESSWAFSREAEPLVRACWQVRDCFNTVDTLVQTEKPFGVWWNGKFYWFGCRLAFYPLAKLPRAVSMQSNYPVSWISGSVAFLCYNPSFQADAMVTYISKKLFGYMPPIIGLVTLLPYIYSSNSTIHHHHHLHHPSLSYVHLLLLARSKWV